MIEPMETYNNVKVFNICDVLEAIYPGYFEMNPWPTYEESGKEVMKWAEANDCAYYAAPKEDFSIYEGVDVAVREGKSGVIVEDMS